METYCSKSWTDINIDFELRELRHCCKARPYQFPDVLTEEFISRGPGIQERRQQSLINIAHRDCDHCWNDYAKGNSAYKDWANKENSVLVNPTRKIPCYDGLFFNEGQEFNQGSYFDWDEDEFISACEEAEKRFESNQVNEEGKRLTKEFTWEKTVKIFLNEMGIN